MNKTKQGDFVFLDPPYIEEHNYNFNYNKSEQLNNKFIHKLYDEVVKLDKKDVKWLMTQANTTEVRDIFKNYRIIEYEVYRALSHSYIYELLIKYSNYKK